VFEDLKSLFRGNHFVGQMIVINAAIFLVVNLVAHLFMGGNERAILEWVALPALLKDFIWTPWSILSYMFLHGGLWHVVFNMYMLYWFGRIFGDFMGDKRLSALYFMGGIAGGALFLLVYNIIFLSGETMPSTILVGSSAAVMAIVVASGARFPDHTLNLLFFGSVKLKYVALVIFLISTVLDFSSNMGGKIAHLGGAAMGYFYVRGLNQGKDYAMSFYNWFQNLSQIFKQKPKLKVVDRDPRVKQSAGRQKSTASYSATTSDNAEVQAKTDAILDKISKSGYDNLTKEEKEFLFKLSKK
jgi:membrane associated rhomboid family serine protease